MELPPMPKVEDFFLCNECLTEEYRDALDAWVVVCTKVVETVSNKGRD